MQRNRKPPRLQANWIAPAGIVHAGIAFSLLLSSPASAGLGDQAESIARDRQLLGAGAAVVVPMAGYERHEFTTGRGAHVREFVRSDGRVFGVAWNGPAMPDLQTMLGSSYNAWVAAAKAHPGGHHLVTIDTPGIRLRVMKLPRGYAGYAHLPERVPLGVDPGQLK